MKYSIVTVLGCDLMLGSTCRDSSMGGLMVTRLNCFEVSLSRARLSWHTRHKMSHNVT